MTTANEIYINSKIITIQHAELISKWIDRLEITDEIEKAYKFQLLLRGSRDGFTPKTFHEICDNQFRTITIIKVKDSNEILGGYNPIAWESNEFDESDESDDELDEENFGTTKDSFIFSFENSVDIESYILSRVERENHATYNRSDFGPTFGICDLDLYGDTGCCNGADYEKHIRESDDIFSVEEYEVFQLVN
ncbi:uncharacterized protein OCT59_027235 [Rhizophagus irregularis]|nr:hypothetical protein OCT59_027235 [Rhizophagus irregularis]